MRRLVYIGLLLVALVGSFFLTLWQLDEGRVSVVDPTDTRSDAERLVSQRVTDYSDLRRAAGKAGLKLSSDMAGSVDTYTRVNERDVAIAGWLADPEGDSDPLKIVIFIAGALAGSTQTGGERPDVTRSLNLAFGTEKNVSFALAFACRSGQQPVVVGLGKQRQYLSMPLAPCP
jgi:hypothetical protein